MAETTSTDQGMFADGRTNWRRSSWLPPPGDGEKFMVKRRKFVIQTAPRSSIENDNAINQSRALDPLLRRRTGQKIVNKEIFEFELN